MAERRKPKQRTSSAKAVARKKAARRRAGDAAALATFRDGVRVRSVRIPDKKKEASRRACRSPKRSAD